MHRTDYTVILIIGYILLHKPCYVLSAGLISVVYMFYDACLCIHELALLYASLSASICKLREAIADCEYSNKSLMCAKYRLYEQTATRARIV